MTWLERMAQGATSQAEAAYYFLGAGGTFGPSDWAELDDSGRASLFAAFNRLRVEQAVRIGRCARGRVGEAVVLSEIDRGELLATLHVEQLVDQVAEAIGGGHGVQ